MRGERIRALSLGVGLLGLMGAGFRGDGTGVHPDATPPADWAASEAWSTPLTTWSNASPVVVGGLVCAGDEPTTLVCLDRSTGAVAWRAEHAVVDALDADGDHDDLRARLDEAAKGEAELTGLKAEQSRLRREVRRSGAAPEVLAALERVSARVAAIQTELRALRPYRTPPDMEQIGYSTPTPTVVDGDLVALFGHGVLARRAASDGTVRWQRWLGTPPEQMRGYSHGSTASPVVADGVLVVAYGQLMGLDPDTGLTRWMGPSYTDYGTPAVVTVGGSSWLVTPAGQAVRASDGHVGAEGLGEVWFASPVASGDAVWFAGGLSSPHDKHGPIAAWRVDLSDDGAGGLATDRAWHTPLPALQRVYASPVVVGDTLVVVDTDGAVAELDAATGALRRERSLREGGSTFYSALVTDGTRVYAGTEGGRTFVWTPGSDDAPVVHRTQGYRSTPLLHGGAVYLRTYAGMVALGQP